MLVGWINANGTDPADRIRNAKFPPTHLTDNKPDHFSLMFSNQTGERISRVREFKLLTPIIWPGLSQNLPVYLYNRIQILNAHRSYVYFRQKIFSHPSLSILPLFNYCDNRFCVDLLTRRDTDLLHLSGNRSHYRHL